MFCFGFFLQHLIHSLNYLVIFKTGVSVHFVSAQESGNASCVRGGGCMWTAPFQLPLLHEMKLVGGGEGRKKTHRPRTLNDQVGI